MRSPPDASMIKEVDRFHHAYLGIVESAPFGIYMVDTDFKLIRISEGAQKVFSPIKDPIGRDFGEVIGALWQDPFRSEVLAKFRHTLATGEDHHAPRTVETRADTGEVEAYDWKLRRVLLPDGRWAVVCYFYDMTERQREQDELRKARERENFLLRLSDALRSLSDPDGIQNEAMRILGEHLGVLRAQYYETEPNDEWLVSAGGFANGVPPIVGRVHMDDFGSYLKEAFRAGRTLAVADGLSDPRVSETEREAYIGLGFRAFIGVPLVKNGRFVAGIGLHHATPRTWTAGEIAITEDVAQRTWATVERARAEKALRISESRNAFLLGLSDALRPLAETEQIQATAARLLGMHLGAARVRYVVAAEDEDLLIAGPGYTNGLPPIEGAVRISQFDGEALELYRAGRTFVSCDMQEDRSGPTLAAVQAMGIRAAVGVPLARNGRLIGILGVHDDKAREWTSAEIDLIEHTAERTWDAVDRAHAERALARSEERYRSLFDSIDEGFCTIEVLFNADEEATDYRFLTANPAFERHTGLVDVIGRTIRELAPAHETSWFEAYGRIAKGGGPMRFEQQADALGRSFDVYAFPVGCPKQHQVAVLFRDITERKAVERRLRESEAQFRAYVTASSDAIFRMNADWTEMHHLVGRAFIADLAVPSRTWLDRYIHREDQPRVIASVAEAMRTGTSFSLEHRVIRADGGTGWAFSRAVPLTDEHGAVTGWFGAATDVTERRQAEEALREAQERYQAFMRHSAEGIWRCEVDHPMPVDLPLPAMLDFAYAHGYLAECNDAMARMYGYADGNELVGARLGDLIPRTPENEAFLTAFFTNGFNATGGESVEQHKDGHEVHFSNNLVGIVENGFLVRVWGTQTDISAQRKAHDELQASESFNRSLMDASPDCVEVLDTEGHLLLMNPPGMALMEIDDLAPFKGRHWCLLWPADVHDDVWNAIDRARNGEETAFDAFCPTAKGTPKWWEVRVLPVRDRVDGPVMRILSISRDITDERQRELDLRESEGRLRMATDTGRVGVWDWNIATDRITWSDMLFEMFRLEQKDFGGTVDDFVALVHPDDRIRMSDAIQRSVRDDVPYDVEFRALRSDGATIWIHTRAQVIRDAEGIPLRMVGATVDITRSKEAEQALKLADRRKDEFLATLAHELRNPLAPLRNGLEVLAIAGDEPRTVQEISEMMARQVDQMVHLVGDLLDLSRISRGVIELRRSPMDLHDAVRRAVEAGSAMLHSNGHELLLDLAPGPLMVDADLTRLTQIFGNLLDNAGKYTPTGGTIRLTSTVDEGSAQVTISDSGIGLAPEQIPNVFDMFSQVDRGSTHARSGLGIGLHIVKRLVEMHGGSIAVRSDGLGKGSCFTVRLPMTVIPARAERSAPAAAATAPLRILLADDNEDAAMMLGMVLRKAGHEVMVLHSGREALEKGAAYAPHVIILDIGMPHMDGHETCRRIRETTWGRAACTIALTGWGQQEDRARSYAAGFDHHLTKPVDRVALNGVLSGVMPVVCGA